MNEILIECTYGEDCAFITRSYTPLVALSKLDDHLQDEHDTDFETEVERLEAEEGEPFEDILQDRIEEQHA